jgi:hypothetical protein
MATATAPQQPSAKPTWSGGHVAMTIVGCLLALFALVPLLSGAYGLWLDTTQRSDGYVMTSSERFATGAYALSTTTLRVSSEVPSFLYGRDWLGTVRLRGESANPARPLFIGIARQADVDRYLAGVAHSVVTDVNANPFGTTYEPSYLARSGGPPARRPDRAGFWVARASGPGVRTLSWNVRRGRWAVVVMRPDGSRGVSADLAAGAELPALLWASIVLLAIGLVMLAAAAAPIYFGLRRQRGKAV